jgi:hypothetical protein
MVTLYTIFTLGLKSFEQCWASRFWTDGRTRSGFPIYVNSSNNERRTIKGILTYNTVGVHNVMGAAYPLRERKRKMTYPRAHVKHLPRKPQITQRPTSASNGQEKSSIWERGFPSMQPPHLDLIHATECKHPRLRRKLIYMLYGFNKSLCGNYARTLDLSWFQQLL